MLFAFSSLFTMAQAKIGFTEQQIRDSLPFVSFKKGETDNSIRYIVYNNDRAIIAYYFDDFGRCYLTAVLPNTQGDLNYFVEVYNNRYVIISSTEWRAYLKNGILKIKLIYPDDNSLAFFQISNFQQ